MVKKVLIAYGSRYGSCKDVADELANILTTEGLQADVWDLKNKKIPSSPLDSYDGFIIGSGIKINKWTKEAENLLKDYNGVAKSDAVLGIFVCCGKALDEKEESVKQYIEKYIDMYGLDPKIYDSFGPSFDLTKDSKVGFLGKKMLKGIAKEMGKKQGVEVKDGEKYDFRDWDKIREFAQEYKEHVTG